LDPAPPPETEVHEEEKPEWFSSLEPHRQRLFVVVGVGLLVVGLLGGFAAGFKVEQNLAETNEVKAETTTPKAAVLRIASLAGVVTEKATDSIDIALLRGFRVKIKLPATLGVKKAVTASLADITVGSAFLQSGTAVGTGNYDAAEIIVLPGDSKFKGLKVTAVNGDRISVVQGEKTPLTVNVKSTTAVYKLDASSVTQIAKGAKVMANGLGALGSDTFYANEIIILVPGSAFAKK
jgi:hypothetical protein